MTRPKVKINILVAMSWCRFAFGNILVVYCFVICGFEINNLIENSTRGDKTTYKFAVWCILIIVLNILGMSKLIKS